MCYDKRRSARLYELTVLNLCTCYFKASFINFYLLFVFILKAKFQNMGSNYDSFYATQRVHFVKLKRSRGKSIHESFTNPNQIFKDSIFLMSQPYWIQVWPSKKLAIFGSIQIIQLRFNIISQIWVHSKKSVLT